MAEGQAGIADEILDIFHEEERFFSLRANVPEVFLIKQLSVSSKDRMPLQIVKNQAEILKLMDFLQKLLEKRSDTLISARSESNGRPESPSGSPFTWKTAARSRKVF